MSRAKKLTLISGAIILAAAGTITGLELSNTTHWFHGEPASNVITKAGKTLPIATPNSSKSSNHNTKSNVSNDTNNSGYATDTGGQSPTPTNKDQWITSQSGVITVKQPVASATLASGTTLAGTTTSAGPIHFILLDNSSGQIATGMLNVVNGSFSGQITFQAHSSNGQLDVFTTAANGREENVIEIGVNFSQ